MAVILVVAAIGAWAIGTGRVSYVVTHGVSMKPLYSAGDLSIIVKSDSYEKGQIAAYHSAGRGSEVLHRIVGGSGTTGYVFKGDNNPEVDLQTPTADELIGRAVLHIPKGGVWLRPLLSPSGLGMLSFLLIGGGVAAERNRREIPRGRRKKRVKAMSRQGGSLASVAAVARAINRLPPLLRAVAATVAALTGLAIALGILGWMSPVTETFRPVSAPGQSIVFSYSAKVAKSPAYDDTTVRSPDPVFRKLTNDVDLHAVYQGPPGKLGITAELTNGTGWRTTLSLLDAKPFTGDRHDAVVKLDLDALTARSDAAAEAIGVGAGNPVGIALTARVTATGLPPFDARVQLQMNSLQMTVANGTPMKSDSTDNAPVPQARTRQIGIFGHPVMTASAARSWAILTLIIAIGGAAAIGLLSRRGTPLRDRVQIERRYPQLLVHVEPMNSPPGKPVVNVDNFPALVKLAERYGQMILTWRRPDADDFIVRDEGITYRYRISLDQPALENIDAINRPNSAGSHRRKASSPVP